MSRVWHCPGKNESGCSSSPSLWLASNPSKRWGELFFLFYTPFWLTLCLGIVVPYKLYEVRFRFPLFGYSENCKVWKLIVGEAVPLKLRLEAIIFLAFSLRERERESTLHNGESFVVIGRALRSGSICLLDWFRLFLLFCYQCYLLGR